MVKLLRGIIWNQQNITEIEDVLGEVKGHLGRGQWSFWEMSSVKLEYFDVPAKSLRPGGRGN